MTELITDEQIAELERLEKEATSGEWTAEGCDVNLGLTRIACCSEGDEEFIATSHNLLPSLLQSYKVLKEENERLGRVRDIIEAFAADELNVGDTVARIRAVLRS
jgi:hypothetical protein